MAYITTVISPLPPFPEESDPETFNAKASAQAAAMPQFVNQTNEVGAQMNAAAAAAAASAASALNVAATQATSTTSLTIGTGTQVLGIQTGKAFVVGQFVMLTATTGNWMHGQITAYNSATGTLTVSVGAVAGSGTFTSWTVSVSAPIVSRELATVQDIWAGTAADKIVTPKVLLDAAAPQPIAFATTLTLNGDTFIHANVGTVTANFSLQAPVNMKPGVSGCIQFKIDATGGRTWSVSSAWKFDGGAAPPMPTTPNAEFELWYFVRSTGVVRAWLDRVS